MMAGRAAMTDNPATTPEFRGRIDAVLKRLVSDGYAVIVEKDGEIGFEITAKGCAKLKEKPDA